MLLRGGETTDRPQKRENDSTNPYGALSFCNEIRDGKKGERLVCSTVLQHPQYVAFRCFICSVSYIFTSVCLTRARVFEVSLERGEEKQRLGRRGK